MKYIGAALLALFVLGGLLEWFSPLDKPDIPGSMRNINPGRGSVFLGGGIHGGK